MNYLAHAYLSFNDREVLAGNMISDFVKGRKKFGYPARIQDGIHLHRLIDGYTDDHPATRAAKDFFKPHYRLYSGAFVDVVYDHFLANDINEFDESALFDFSTRVYVMLEQQQQWFPDRFAVLFPYMKLQNWLFNYRTRWGTEKSFGGVVRRSTYLAESETACAVFRRHYQPLQEYYRQFWKDVRPFAQEQFNLLGSLPDH